MSAPEYEQITLTAETAAKHKCMRCTHEGQQFFMVIQIVTDSYCWGMNVDTFATRNYTYNQLPEGMTFEAVPKWDIKTHIKEHLQALDNEVAQATEKREMYLRAVTTTFFRLLLD